MSKSDEQIERESNKRQARDANKGLPPTARRGAGTADWEGADPKQLLRLVCSVGVQGGAVRYGYTRDGGAYSVGIYMGEHSKTYYCNEKDGINELLQELCSFFD